MFRSTADTSPPAISVLRCHRDALRGPKASVSLQCVNVGQMWPSFNCLTILLEKVRSDVIDRSSDSVTKRKVNVTHFLAEKRKGGGDVRVCRTRQGE